MSRSARGVNRTRCPWPGRERWPCLPPARVPRVREESWPGAAGSPMGLAPSDMDVGRLREGSSERERGRIPRGRSDRIDDPRAGCARASSRFSPLRERVTEDAKRRRLAGPRDERWEGNFPADFTPGERPPPGASEGGGWQIATPRVVWPAPLGGAARFARAGSFSLRRFCRRNQPWRTAPLARSHRPASPSDPDPPCCLVPAGGPGRWSRPGRAVAAIYTYYAYFSFARFPIRPPAGTSASPRAWRLAPWRERAPNRPRRAPVARFRSDGARFEYT